MKAALNISILLNLVLAGILVFGWESRRPAANAMVVPATVAAAPAVAEAKTVVVKTLPPETKPFHWSQLESSDDYRVFVANLRRAGCPEPTVEDIVRGDAERAFFAKRSELHVDGTEPGPWSGQSQVHLVAYLLGQAPAATSETPGPANRLQPGPPPSYPLFLQNVDLNAAGLTEDQKQHVAEIREEFIESIGGPNQDPADPAYLARWRRAQHVADEELRGWLGFQGVINYGLAADAAKAQ